MQNKIPKSTQEKVLLKYVDQLHCKEGVKKKYKPVSLVIKLFRELLWSQFLPIHSHKVQVFVFCYTGSQVLAVRICLEISAVHV